MRGVVLQAGELQYRGDLPEPEPVSSEVLVRVLKAGICETDLQLVKGYMGFEGILGHEFVGVAETGKHAGRRVVGEINCACGECAYGQAGVKSHCPHRTVLGILNRNGAFADRLLLPEENLHANSSQTGEIARETTRRGKLKWRSIEPQIGTESHR